MSRLELPPFDREPLPVFTPEQYAEALDNYIAAGTAAETLRPRQLPILTDFRDMFRDGEVRGYVQSPTGTGKTVVFVELIKALLGTRNENGDQPRFLVVDPLKDLVHQTEGRSGQRGFGRFAPGLPIGTFFSDTLPKDRERIAQQQVVLTTYRSLKILGKYNLLREQTDDEQNEFLREIIASSVERSGVSFDTIQRDYAEAYNRFTATNERVSTGNQLLNLFNVIIFDEGHHVMGPETAEIVEALPDHVAAIGFTATPDADKDRRLKNHLPRRIHRFDLREAIESEVLAPVVAVGVSSSTTLESNVTYDDLGDYEDAALGHLATSERRNDLIIKAAEVLSAAGLGVLVNTVAGSQAWHARHLADRMNEAGLRAVAIHDRMRSKKRIEHYEAFEEGELDVLTYYGILAEGYDSNRAKGLVNGRPTRSRIVGEQRLGRILRPGSPAFAIDIVDAQVSPNSPYRIPDIIGDKAIKLGEALGPLSSDEKAFVRNLITKLGQTVPVLSSLRAEHHEFEELAGSYPSIRNGVLQVGGAAAYRTINTLHRKIRGLNEDVLAELQKQLKGNIDTALGSTEHTIHVTYNVNEAVRLIDSLPLTDPAQFYTDERGNWATVQGIKALFAKLFPDITEGTISETLAQPEHELLTQLLRSVHQTARGESHTTVHRAYLIDDRFVQVAKAALGKQTKGADGDIA